MKADMKCKAICLIAIMTTAGIVRTSTAAVQSWTGAAGTDNGLTPENWSGNAMPFGADAGLDVGLPNGTNVTMLATSADHLWTNSTVTVGPGAVLRLARESFFGSAIYEIGRFRNEGSVFVTTRSATGFLLNLGPGSENSGEIDLTTSSNADSKSLMTLLDPGEFVNNGRITLRGVGTGTAAIRLGSSSKDKYYYSFGGNGSVAFESGGKIVLGSLAVLTNGSAHAITGAGQVDQVGVENLGLIRASDNRPGLSSADLLTLELSCKDHRTTASAFGSAVRNHAGGRIIAMESSGGLLVGHVSSVSTFVNNGLLEARTGSKIEIREGATEATGKNVADPVVRFGGVLAGDGSIVTHRPVEVKAGATIRPGNLTLNAEGEDDGLGASLVGTLTFTTNVTLKAGSSVEIQGDTSTRRVDGIVVDGDLTVEEGVTLALPSERMPSGTFRLLTAKSLPVDILDLLSVRRDVTLQKVRLSVGSHMVGSVAWYSLDATVSAGGFVIMIR